MRKKIFIGLLLIIFLVSGCVGHVTYHNKKADDAISHAYENMQKLLLVGYQFGNISDFYNNPEVYTNVRGIKSLEISQEMQTRAEEQEIDWYEVEVEVYYDYTEDGVKKEGTYSIEKDKGAVHE